MISEDKIQDVYNLVSSFCKKYNIYSEENVQDMTWKVWLKLDKLYDETKSKLSTYVFLCCKHFYFQQLRKKKIEVSSLNEDVADGIELMYLIESEYSDPLEVLIEREESQLLNNICDTCSETLKLYLNGDTQKEIGIKLGISQAQVSRRIKKELEQIRKKVM